MFLKYFYISISIGPTVCPWWHHCNAPCKKAKVDNFLQSTLDRGSL